MILQQLNFKRTANEDSLIGQAVNDSHYNNLIEQSSYVQLDKGKPVVYLNLDDKRFDELIPLLRGLNLSKSTRRILGDTNQSLLFGAVPPKINRANFCTVGATISHSTKLNKLLTLKYSIVADRFMQLYLPQWHKVGHVN